MASDPTLAEARDAPRAGVVVDGYTIGERIHAGGTGNIFRVTAPAAIDPGFPLVMKTPALGRAQPAIGMLAFEMELMILPALRGPHVPRYLASADFDATPYLVMEYVQGESLAAIAARAPIEPEEVARIGAALADAVHALHGQGAIHHDLKPENVILRGGLEAVLLDFGFAHHARYPDLIAEAAHFEAGSAPYVSPEQLLHRRDDPRGDLFALGAMLYELATGEAPFGEPSTAAGMRDRLWRAPLPPRAANPQVPPWLQEVILKCLETDAAARYQSAAQVAFDLRNPAQVALTARAGLLDTPGIPAQIARWWRSRRTPLDAAAPPRRESRVVLVAVDTTHLEDERHPSIQWAARQVLALGNDDRMLCVSVIRAAPLGEGERLEDTASGRHLEHLAKLRRWVAPLAVSAERLSLHVVESADPAETLVDLATRNHVDLVVLGAPMPTQKRFAWWRSVASGVTANAPCSVLVVRVPGTEPGDL